MKNYYFLFLAGLLFSEAVLPGCKKNEIIEVEYIVPVWKGTLETAPSDPEPGWAYYDPKIGCSFIFDGKSWQVMSQDGKDGLNGKDGKDGIDGKNGKDGKDGIDGKDGKDAEVLMPKTEQSAVVPEGYVDFGGAVYWSQESMSEKYSWRQADEMLKNSTDKLPSMEDFEELCKKCTWQWQENFNGRKGYLVYKPDNKDNYIFLAAPKGTGGAYYANYWSSTPGDGFFNSLYFDSKYIDPVKIYGEMQNFSVITVRKKN